ncbi:MAG: hypothetical protein JRN06_10150 [Nitrososphaerota archaeon]|nr:hypothetical protein [Nitrososphaerota archaeon]MDG7024949.1 hypothetical protein [Nitrososphaerota archaeon]
MVGRPTSAFFFSAVGGAITLVVALTAIRSWFVLHSELGAGFGYSSLALGSVPSAEAMVLFIIGAFCGISIIVGAFLQYSGGKRKVRLGSTLVLVASVVSIPTTFFGGVFGGVLSITGVVLGFAWKPLREASSGEPGSWMIAPSPLSPSLSRVSSEPTDLS